MAQEALGSSCVGDEDDSVSWPEKLGRWTVRPFACQRAQSGVERRALSAFS